MQDDAIAQWCRVQVVASEGCTVRQTHRCRHFTLSTRTEHWASSKVSCSCSFMGMPTNSWSNEIITLVKALSLMERHRIVGAWSRYHHSLYADPDPILSVRAFNPCQSGSSQAK